MSEKPRVRMLCPTGDADAFEMRIHSDPIARYRFRISNVERQMARSPAQIIEHHFRKAYIALMGNAA